MKLARIAGFASIVVACAGHAPAVPAESFGYLGWFEYEGEWIEIEMPTGDSTEGTVFLGTDDGRIAEFCRARASMHCFRSVSIAFAMPKSTKPLPAEWEHKGTRCRLKKSDLRVEIFGRSYDGVALVRCRGKKVKPYSAETDEYSFLFSRAAGLIAIGPPAASVPMWIGTEKGPFASPP